MIGRHPIGFRAAGLALWMVLLTAGGAVAERSSTIAQEFPESALAGLRRSLGIYEQVRVELVGDQLERVPAHALRLAGALRLTAVGGTELTGVVPVIIEQAGRAAEELAEAEDLATARVAFGEVSRGLMLLAESDPRLVEGWHVFACPMVESFAKWLQPTEDLANPYMGPSMPKCGFASDWSVPAPLSARLAAKEAAAANPVFSGPEPEFKPGIPGLEMVDVRDHKFLWREIDELQIWERGDRITVAEFRSKAIEKTAHFLELEGVAADEFIAAATAAVTDVRQSFQKRQTDGETSGVEGQFSSQLGAATDRLTSLLQDQPRHRLFAPGCKKWLLRLAFGPKESKEARERASVSAP